MASTTSTTWDGAAVHLWLERRIAAARADQVTAERGGRGQQDDCDKAAAEEMVCTLVRKDAATADQAAFTAALRSVLDRDDHVWRGVYDDMRFDRHVRSYVRELMKMAKTNSGFGNVTHYQ